MPNTKRDEVTDLIVTLLGTTPPGGVPVAKRGFLFDMSAASVPAITVFPENDDLELRGDGKGAPDITKHRVAIRVEVRAKSDTTHSADQNAELMLNWIEKTLNGRIPTDRTGPFHIMHIDSIEWDYEQMEHGYVLVKNKLIVELQNKYNDPNAWT